MTAPARPRPHGRAKYVVEKCRCDVCREDNRIKAQEWRRAKLYGRYNKYVDAEPVRAHVRSLMAQGMGWKRVAIAAGLNPSTVWKTVYGDLTRFDGPTKKVTRMTAEALLAVELDLADGAQILAHGTRRRLQALVALGWSQNKLATRLGWTPANFSKMLLHQGQVTVATADAVKALYDDLSMTPPAPTDWRDAGSITRAKSRAAHLMWLPPLAWDDDDIDDPSATPAHMAEGSRRSEDVDPAVIERILAGDWSLARDANPAERGHIVAAWAERELPLTHLANLTGWKVERYAKKGDLSRDMSNGRVENRTPSDQQCSTRTVDNNLHKTGERVFDESATTTKEGVA